MGARDSSQTTGYQGVCLSLFPVSALQFRLGAKGDVKFAQLRPEFVPSTNIIGVCEGVMPWNN